MDINHMSTAALQMKLREILRENESLKDDIKLKQSKIEELTDFLDYEGYDESDVVKYTELKKYDFEADEVEDKLSFDKPKYINGVEVKLPLKEQVKKALNDFDWDIMIPIGSVAIVAIGMIIAALCGHPL